MHIYDCRKSESLTKSASQNSIVNIKMNDGAGSVSAIMKEGFELTLEYEEIEAFAREMMTKYTGNLTFREE